MLVIKKIYIFAFEITLKINVMNNKKMDFAVCNDGFYCNGCN